MSEKPLNSRQADKAREERAMEQARAAREALRLLPPGPPGPFWGGGGRR